MKTFFPTFIFLLAFGLSGCTSLITPTVETEIPKLDGGNYQIDPAHSRVIFKVGHIGLSKYVGRFNTFDARLEFDPEKPEQTKLEATVDTVSIDVADTDFSESLAGSTWLDSEDFPKAYFKSSSIKLKEKNPEGKQTALFCGNLTLISVTKPLCFDVTFNGGAFNVLSASYTLGFEAHASFNRSDFGMDSYIPAVSDGVELEIHAEFIKR